MTLKLDLISRPPASERGRHRYGQQLARRIVRNPDTSHTATNVGLQNATRIADRAALWAAPWDARHYPGRQRLLQTIMGRSITRDMITKWRSGARPLPVWAALALANAITTRAEDGLAIAQQLIAYAREKQALDDARGANLRAMRAAGVAPSGLGARGGNAAPK